MGDALTDAHAFLALPLGGKVRARAERPAGACQHEHARIRRGGHLGDRFAHFLDELHVDAVQHVGPVQRQEGDAIRDFELDRFPVGIHGAVPP